MRGRGSIVRDQSYSKILDIADIESVTRALDDIARRVQFSGESITIISRETPSADEVTRIWVNISLAFRYKANHIIDSVRNI